MRLVTVAAMLLVSLQAPQLPEGEDLMRRVQEAHHDFTSLQFDSETTSERSGHASPNYHPMRSTTSSARVRSGKSRTETNNYGMTVITVSDGETIWTYDPDHREYVKVAAPVMAAHAAGVNMHGRPRPYYTPRTLREEALETDGQKYDCWVLETRIEDMATSGSHPAAGRPATTGMVITEWIDKKLLVQRQSTTAMTVEMPGKPSVETLSRTVYKNYRINEAIPDSMFAFIPPPDAKEVKALIVRSIPDTDLVGKEAPDFQVKGLDAKPYSLAALKGKAVLLDFWATWCGPCRKSVPVLEKIYHDYRDQGLLILAVNSGEDRETVEAFLKKTPLAYPTVLSGNSGIREAYRAGAIPTFVLIGRDGRILAQQIGFDSEAELREMIEKAGLPAKSQ